MRSGEALLAIRREELKPINKRSLRNFRFGLTNSEHGIVRVITVAIAGFNNRRSSPTHCKYSPGEVSFPKELPLPQFKVKLDKSRTVPGISSGSLPTFVPKMFIHFTASPRYTKRRDDPLLLKAVSSKLFIEFILNLFTTQP